MPHYVPAQPLAQRLTAFWWTAHQGYHTLAPGEPGWGERPRRTEHEQVVWKDQDLAFHDRFWGLVVAVEAMEAELAKLRRKPAVRSAKDVELYTAAVRAQQPPAPDGEA